MGDLEVLQTVRLKGRVGADDLAAALGADPHADVERLVAQGRLVSGNALRLTAEGRAALVDLLADERRTVDGAAAAAVYEQFTPINAEFKAALSLWQLQRADGGGEGGAEVLATVRDVHERVTPVVAAAGDLLARLNRYGERLDGALRKAIDGDLSWLSRPLVDSYHTVWFELHEELIGLAGRVRDSD